MNFCVVLKSVMANRMAESSDNEKSGDILMLVTLFRFMANQCHVEIEQVSVTFFQILF